MNMDTVIATRPHKVIYRDGTQIDTIRCVASK